MVTGGETCLGVGIAILILCALTQVPWERVMAALTNFLWPEKKSRRRKRRRD